MSKEYDLYLQEHKANVKKGFEWIRENLPELVDEHINGKLGDLEWQICAAHDTSKNYSEEYNAYDRYFYGNNRSYQVVQDFNYAWLYHIHSNPHHWQYWILNNDDPEEGEIIMDMPYNYILEMICDWWAFSWSKGNLREVYDWYQKRYYYIKLSDRTRETVDDILRKIQLKLTELEAATEKNKESED